MATDLTTVEYVDGVLTYDKDMRMGDLRGLFKAANEGNLGALFDAYSRIVYTWPFEGSPQDPVAWDGITRGQFARLNEAVMGSLQDEGEA